VILGETVLARAVALAGALAELSQTRLILHVRGAEVEVSARVTNLPGVLVEEVERGGASRVSAPGLGAEFVLTRDGGTWECAEKHVAERLREKVQR
jgi:hypothetical protein